MLTHDFVVSIYNNNGGYQAGNGWNGNDVFYTFLRLRRDSDMDKVNDNIQRVIENTPRLPLTTGKWITVLFRL